MPTVPRRPRQRRRRRGARRRHRRRRGDDNDEDEDDNEEDDPFFPSAPDRRARGLGGWFRISETRRGGETTQRLCHRRQPRRREAARLATRRARRNAPHAGASGLIEQTTQTLAPPPSAPSHLPTLTVVLRHSSAPPRPQINKCLSRRRRPSASSGWRSRARLTSARSDARENYNARENSDDACRAVFGIPSEKGE